MENKLTYTGTLYNNHIERNKEWIKTAQILQETKLILKKLKKEEELLLENLKRLSEGVNSRGGPFVFSKKDIECLKLEMVLASE